MLPAIGVAKLLGIIALLVPGFPRIKEWAYAGFFFDLTGAVYSGLAVAGFDPLMLIMPLHTYWVHCQISIITRESGNN